MVAAAAVGSAVVGGVASASSARSAAKASGKAADASAATQMAMFDQNREDLAPWRSTGRNALQLYSEMLGVPYAETTAKPGEQTFENFDVDAYLKSNPDVADPRRWAGQSPEDIFNHWKAYGRQEGRAFTYKVPPGASTSAPGSQDYSAFYKSPDYQFAYDEGLRATNAGLAARGLSNSGRAMKELTRYGQGMASQQLGTYLNRLASLAGVGQTATTTTAQLGANAATNIGAAQQNAGDARASGYLAQGNAINSAINNGWGTYAMMNMMKG